MEMTLGVGKKVERVLMMVDMPEEGRERDLVVAVLNCLK